MFCFRWAQFRQSYDEIDLKVKALVAKENVHYCNHIGGGVHVSVNTGYLCIDLRKFYRPEQQTEMKPTRQGIALRIKEWYSLKQVIDSINDNFPALGTAVPCYFSDDHGYQEDCKECYPYA